MSKAKVFWPLKFNSESATGNTSSGKTAVVENEVVIYGKLLTSKADLEQIADKVETIEQYTVFSNSLDGKARGQVRARCTNRVVFEQAVKIYMPGLPPDEYEETCSEALFTNMSRVANNGILKTRYTFKVDSPLIPGLCYQLDVMSTKTGQATYAKVDIELPASVNTKEAYAEVLRSLPGFKFKLTERVIVIPGGRCSEAQAIIKSMTSDWNIC